MLSRKQFIAGSIGILVALLTPPLASLTQPVLAQASFGLLRRTQCPVYLRVINAANPNLPMPVDLLVNGVQIASHVPFREVSAYVPVRSGGLTVQIVQSGSTTLIGKRTFFAPPNSAYTIGVTGPVAGPEGQQLYNTSPFVIQEDLTPPNPGKFKGKFYRFSETSAVIDFRVSTPADPATDVMRIRDLVPKTAIEYPEITAGIYNFNPVLPGSSDPLINTAFDPPVQVEVVNAEISAGVIFDVIATGNALGISPNSLLLSTTSTRTAPPDANGCTVISTVIDG
jgi:hypothetical protein